MATEAASQLMALYPRIFFACHTRHVQDPRTRKVLSAHQASILDHLDGVEPTSVMGLAKHMGVSASTMSISIDRLERRGYVRRARDPADGRRVNLTLTKPGVRIKEAKSVLDPRRVEAMLEALSERERTDALRGLALLAGAAQAALHSKRLFGLGRARRGRGSAGPRDGAAGRETRSAKDEMGVDPRRRGRGAAAGARRGRAAGSQGSRRKPNR